MPDGEDQNTTVTNPPDTPSTPDASSDQTQATPPSTPQPPDIIQQADQIRANPMANRPPQQQQQPQGPNPQQQAAFADIASHSQFGKAARFLLGQQVDYKVTPDGQIVQVPVQQTPGSMFRSLVAGAILGGAAAANTPVSNGVAGGFGAGFVRGGAAGLQQAQQEDQQRYQRAQQAFENQLKMKADQRADQAAQGEAQLRTAEIAHSNAMTLHENFLLQKDQQTSSIEAGQTGKAMLQPFLDAGSEMKYQDIGESQMKQIMASNPQAGAYLWQQTGVQAKQDAKGNIYLEKTYSAVDPRGTVKITQGMIDEWKAVGLDKFAPDIKKFKVGQEISADDAVKLMTQYKQRFIQKKTEDTTNLDIQDKQSQIRERNATAAHLAQETAKSKLDEKDSQLYSKALDELDKAGGDFDKLTPGSKQVIAKNTTQLITALSNAAKAAYAAGNTDEATELMKQVAQLSQLVPRAFGQPTPQTQGGGGDKVNQTVNDVTGKGQQYNPSTMQNEPTAKQDPMQAFGTISGRTDLTPQQKIAAMKQSGAVVPYEKAMEQSRATKTPLDQVIKNWQSQGIQVQSQADYNKAVNESLKDRAPL